YPLHTSVTLEDVQAEYKQRLFLSNQRNPILVKLRGMVFFSNDARKYLAGPENVAITSAAAVVLDPSAGYQKHSSILMDMFKEFDKPPFPVEIFDNEDEAIAWLKKQMRLSQ